MSKYMGTTNFGSNVKNVIVNALILYLGSMMTKILQ